MKSLNTSTILHILNATEENDNLEFIDETDILMLIGPNTDIKLLLFALAQRVDKDLFYIVLKYTLFHYPDIAKNYLYDAVDFDAMDYLMNYVKIQHPKMKKKQKSSALNFISTEIKQEVVQILNDFTIAFREFVKANPGIVFLNPYWIGIPLDVFEYFTLETKQFKDLFSTGKEMVSLFSDKTKAQQEYKAVLNKFKTVLSPLMAEEGKETEDISIVFYTHLKDIIQQLPEYQNGNDQIKTIADRLIAIKTNYVFSFSMQGQVTNVNSEVTFSYKNGIKDDSFEYQHKDSYYYDEAIYNLKQAIIDKTNEVLKSVYGNIEQDIKSLKVKVVLGRIDQPNGVKLSPGAKYFFEGMKKFLPKI